MTSFVPRRLLVLCVAACAFVLPAAPAVPAAASDSKTGYKMSQGDAEAALRPHGIEWASSGNCTDRENTHCTSFEQVNSGTIDGVIVLRDSSGCPVTITGGTERGHASGVYSHWNGYKVDVRTDPQRTTCIDTYIRDHTTYIGKREKDNAPLYKSPDGDLYANEGGHWDILYF
jgi:hypothetical protein